MSASQDPQQGTEDSQPIAQNVAGPTAAATNGVGENLTCQWTSCGERCASPELLYDHVCERHVGRKSTNNLNLTCQWGSCRTTTVKRDHITSHIRVHVPLKPHKCDFCGKAFKRPQDLKKHVKTHAEDSVILRSPEQGSARPTGNMYVPTEKGPANYYNNINPGAGYDAGHPQGGNQYYQPQASQGGHQPYGNVYYAAPPTQQAALSDMEIRKRGIEALDRFLGDVKARRFDTSSYQHIGQRLLELQGLQLPVIPQTLPTQVPAYQPVPVLASGVGLYNSNDPMQGYALPPMGSAKTRGDLTSLDQILEQMQQAIYENDTQLAQAGMGQPGAHYVNYRTSVSPPGVQLPSTHATSSPLTHQRLASASDSVSTPALSPPSSAQSFTSGHSPISAHLTPSGSTGMYPSLPTGTLDNGFPGTSSAPSATLGNIYDDDRRQYGGGMLRRAQPAPRTSDAMDTRSDSSMTPPASKPIAKAKKSARQSQANSVIDPALSGMSEVASAALKSPASTTTEISEREQERDVCIEHMKMMDWIRKLVQERMRLMDDQEDKPTKSSDDIDMGEAATDDADIDAEDKHVATTLKKELESAAKEGEALYPTLKSA